MQEMNSRVVGSSENLGGRIYGGHNLLSLVYTGLTDLPKSEGPPLTPRVRHLRILSLGNDPKNHVTSDHANYGSVHLDNTLLLAATCRAARYKFS